MLARISRKLCLFTEGLQAPRRVALLIIHRHLTDCPAWKGRLGLCMCNFWLVVSPDMSEFQGLLLLLYYSFFIQSRIFQIIFSTPALHSVSTMLMWSLNSEPHSGFSLYTHCVHRWVREGTEELKIRSSTNHEAPVVPHSLTQNLFWSLWPQFLHL